MPVPNNCLDLIDEVNRGKFSDAELERVLTILNDVKEANLAERGLKTLDADLTEAAAELITETERKAAKKKREVLDAIIKGRDLMDLSAEAFRATGDASMGLQAAMVGVNAPFFGARASVDAKANGLFNTLLGGLMHEFREGDLVRAFNDVDQELDIVKELFDVTFKQPKGNLTKNLEAKKIAKLIDKWQRLAIDIENRAGADVQIRQGRIVRSTHDGGRMAREGFDAWSKFERDLIDWETMKVKEKDIDGVLRDIFRDITTGGRRPDDDVVVGLDPTIDVAKRANASRRIVYKTAEGWYEHNKRFGFRTFKEALFTDFRAAAQNTALIDTFGVRPGAMIKRIQAKLTKLHIDDPKQSPLINNRRIGNQLKEIDGSINLDQGGMHFYNSANLGRSVRALLSMAKLGGSFITSLGDPFFGAAANRQIYGGILRPHARAFTAVFNGLTSAQTKRLATRMLLGMDTQLGEIAQRYHAQDNLSGHTAEAMRLFFKYNLLGPWTDANKRGIGVMRANELGELGAKPFEQLPAGWRTFLSRFGFDERKWEIARASIITVEGKPFMLPGEVHNIGQKLQSPDGAQQLKILPSVFEGLSERERVNLLDEVQSDLGALYADATDTATPTPGARERAILRQGLEPGMVTGEMARYFSQLKGFPVTISTKVLGPILFGKGANRLFRDALLKGEGDLIGLASVIAGTTVIGMISSQLLQMTKGREPLPWDEKLLLAGFLRGGAGGLYADFLLADNERFGRSFLAQLGGPLASETNTAFRLLAQLQAGQDIRAGSLRFIQGNIPFQNLFYTKAALDYLIFFQLQEMVNPGYLARMERGFQSDRGQGFFIPPSRVIPRGGVL